MREMDLINTKLTVVNLMYATFGFALLWLQAAMDYTAMLPHPTLAGIGLVCAAIGGLVSWLWERKKNPKASLRTNITFAIGICILVGLLTYDTMISRGMVNLWLACLVATGFANQMCWQLVALVLRRRISDTFNLRDSDYGTDDEETASNRGSSRRRGKERNKMAEVIPLESAGDRLGARHSASVLSESAVEKQQRTGSER